jgi:hypothetical protein
MNVKIFPPGTKKPMKAHAAGQVLSGLGVTVGQSPVPVGSMTGLDSAGDPVSFGPSATLTVTVDNPAVVTLAVSGQTITPTLVAAGTATATITETFSDGTPTLSGTSLITVAAGPAGSLVLNWG